MTKMTTMIATDAVMLIAFRLVTFILSSRRELTLEFI